MQLLQQQKLWLAIGLLWCSLLWLTAALFSPVATLGLHDLLRLLTPTRTTCTHPRSFVYRPTTVVKRSLIVGPAVYCSLEFLVRKAVLDIEKFFESRVAHFVNIPREHGQVT